MSTYDERLEEAQDLADYTCTTQRGRPEPRHAPRRTFDHLAQPHRHIVVQDGRARLTWYGRNALESVRSRGPRPSRYPLAQLHMIELAIGCDIASRVAVAKWRQELS